MALLRLEPVVLRIWVDETETGINMDVCDGEGCSHVELTDAEADRVANALMRVVESRLEGRAV